MDKILRFLEEHVEKIVLGIVALVCIWPFVMYVIISPNTVTFDRETFTPGAIDGYIKKQARSLEAKLDEPPSSPNSYEPKLNEYRALVASAIKGVDFSISPPVPESNPQGGIIVRKYNLPAVGTVDDVLVGHIRAVVYEPISEVSMERPYNSTESEPNDLDFVTVQGSFDIAGLHKRFNESFAGPSVKAEWRDPCNAEPVFAAVQLQRQEVNDDGLWSEWQDVPRAKIDPYRELFTIIEDARSLPPGGLMVRMLQYKNRDVQIDLLQPAPYQIASANEEWFPPTLYEEFRDVQAAQAAAERRKALEAQKEEKAQDDGSGRRRSATGTGMGRDTLSGVVSGIGGVTGSLYGGGRDSRGRTSSPSSGRRSGSSGTGLTTDGGRYGSRNRSARTRGRDDTTYQDNTGLYGSSTGTGQTTTGPTMDDVYAQLDEISVTPMTDLRRLATLMFWAHDDTVEAGKIYRYRVRLGVFNPVAGKSQVSKLDEASKDEVILWSDFSGATEVVDIPRRLYFFAKGMAKEEAKEVTVQVSKFVLGYWYSEDFNVKSGEAIGDFVQREVEKKRPLPGGTGSRPLPGGTVNRPLTGGPGSRPSPYDSLYNMPTGYVTEQAPEPDSVDYDTGAVVVDVVEVDDWSGDKTMRERRYFDMLYSYDGANIEHMPIGEKYWPGELQAVRSDISAAQKEPRKPLRAWSGAAGGGRIQQPSTRYMGIGGTDDMPYRGRGGMIDTMRRP